MHHIHVHLRPGQCHAAILQQCQQALHPHRETGCGCRFAADLLDQPVITAAGADGALRAEARGHPLEHGAVVIIQAAHQARIDLERHVMPPEDVLHCGKVLQRVVFQLVHQLRCRSYQLLHRRILAVQDAQWIAVQTARRIGIQRIPVLLEMGDQPGAMTMARCGIAERIQLQRDIAQPEFVPQPRAHQDLFGIDVRSGKAQRLHAELMELAIASLLRTLMAEHLTAVIQTLRRVIQQIVLQHGAHAGGRSLGAQRQLVAVQRIGEAVHLFFDDVGHFADGALEQICRLDQWHADIAIAITVQPVAHHFLEP